MPRSLVIRISASRFPRLAFRFLQREMKMAPTRAAADDHSYVKVTVYALLSHIVNTVDQLTSV